MKKELTVSYSATALAILAAIALSFSLLMVAVLAQEEEELLVEEELVPEESAGVTPDSPLYIFDKIVDDVQLALAKGDDKTRKALEIKEERLAEASVMVDKKKPDAAQSALELARKAAEQAQKELSPDLEKETNENVRRAAKLLSGLEEKLSDEQWEEAKKALDAQLSEEEKVRVALLVSKSRLSYCDSIAKEDFDLMKGDELCQIDKAPEWLRGKVEGEFRAREENARKQILDSVSTCIVDPKKCDCSQIPVAKHSQDCEVKKALAIRCEYENDNEACAKLSSEKVEDFLPEFVGEEGKETILAALRGKEQQMFERFKPPECQAVSTFQECFAIMKDLYGEPPECEGLSDDECAELMKSKTPEEHMMDFPPECREAGVTTPLECAEFMFSKYGKPPQCEGLDTRECMKLMRHERPDAANFAMPPECQEAGAKEPRQCFDIMTAKYGFPPECEGLSTDECFQKMMKEGPQGRAGDCIGLSPEECRAKIQEQHDLPPECAQNPEQCAHAFGQRGLAEGMPAECAGLERGQCERIMMQKFGPPECKEVSTREECEAIMKEEYGSEGGFGGAPGPGGPGGFEGKGGFGRGSGSECEGLAREECEQKMFERFAPPECSGMTKEECNRAMRERFEQGAGQAERHEGFGSSGIQIGESPIAHSASGGIVPSECQGLNEEECRQKFFEGKREGEIMGEGEHREFPGQPSECQGLSASECSSVMEEKFRTQQPQQTNVPQQQYPSGQFPTGTYPEPAGEYPQPSIATTITGHIIKALYWVGGR